MGKFFWLILGLAAFVAAQNCGVQAGKVQNVGTIISDRYVYQDGGFGFSCAVWDLTSSATFPVAFCDGAGGGTLSGNRAYVMTSNDYGAGCWEQAYVTDLTIPSSPVVSLSSICYDQPGTMNSCIGNQVGYISNYIYTAQSSQCGDANCYSIHTINMTNPTNPIDLESFNINNAYLFYSLVSSTNIAFIVAYTYPGPLTLLSYSIANPAQPSFIGSVEIPTSVIDDSQPMSSCNIPRWSLLGPYAFINPCPNTINGGPVLFRLDNPSAPSFMLPFPPNAAGIIDNGGYWVQPSFLDGSIMFVTASERGIAIFIVADLSNPIFLGWYRQSGGNAQVIGKYQSKYLLSDGTLVDFSSCGGTPPSPPVANFSWTPSLVYVGKTVSFKDTSTGSPTSWAWVFGDGGTSTLQNPTHIYNAKGVYNVKLTATNSEGSNSATKSITVRSTFP